MINHRGTCEEPDCGRIWRENCEHCLREVTAKHQAETGHSVHLTITADEQVSANILTMASRARRMLLTGRIDR